MKLKDLYAELREMQSKVIARDKAGDMLKELGEDSYADWATPIERKVLSEYLRPALERAVKELTEVVDSLEIDAELVDLLEAPGDRGI